MKVLIFCTVAEAWGLTSGGFSITGSSLLQPAIKIIIVITMCSLYLKSILILNTGFLNCPFRALVFWDFIFPRRCHRAELIWAFSPQKSKNGFPFFLNNLITYFHSCPSDRTGRHSRIHAFPTRS